MRFLRAFCKPVLSRDYKLLIMRNYQFYVYIMTNGSGTLYTGVTGNAEIRQWQHANK